MEVLDATSLAERLKWEAKEYWLHFEAESPLEKYPAKQHARRVQEKLGVEKGLIYLPGQQARNNDDSDMPAPFRQHRYFYYLSGCVEADCHLTYDIQHDILSLFIPRIDENRVIWNGRGSTLAEALVAYDVDEVYYSDEISDYLQDWCHHNRNKGDLYFLHGVHSARSPRVVGGGPVNTTSLKPAMNIARMVKDDYEINLIRKANDISSKAHREVLANISKFKNEAQVEGLFLDICVSRQAKQQAYDPIAASGPNAGTLHYDANNEDFADRQIMCLDAGCEFELYASDITRTFPLSSSWPSKEAENIYKLVEHMQESCIKRLAPGVRYLDLHILAHQVAIDGLLALGVLHNGTKEEIYKAGTSRAFFPHGLGHHIGLEVHDVGQAELMSVRRGKAIEQTLSLYPESFHLPVYDSTTCHAPSDPQSSHLEEGMVVTVEPGIYFSAYAFEHFYRHSPIHSKFINFDVVKRYLPVGGVRIEDDILITSKGYENLTTAPKGDAMLEIIRTGDADKISCTSSRQSSQRKQRDEKPSLCRAPGISTDRITDMLKPIARASTMPAEFKQPAVDFEPSQGPSLFANFKRSMTTDERIQQWQRDRDNLLVSQTRPTATKQPSSVCGTVIKGVRHVYMTSGSHRTVPPGSAHAEHYLPVCKKCTILCETLDRLRKNLTLTEQSAPESESHPGITTASQSKVQSGPCNDVSDTDQRTKLTREISTVAGRRQQAAKTRPHLPPYDESLAWGEKYMKVTSQQASERTTSNHQQDPISTRDMQAPQEDAVLSFIEQFEQLRCKMVDDLAKPLQLIPTSPTSPVQVLRSQPPQNDPRSQEKTDESKAHDATHQPQDSPDTQDWEAERQARAIATLADLKEQRQRNAAKGIHRVDVQIEYPQPSLWEQGVAQARAAIPQGNNVEWLQRQIKNLEGQLRARAPPF